MVSKKDIIKNIVTPSYIFDLSKIEDRINIMREKLNNVYLCYAMKANPFIVKEVSQLVERLEVCSYGEYEICKREKIDPDKIIVSGVNKTKEALDKILEYSKGKGIYTIESERQLDLLSVCAKESGYRLKVIVRLTSGNQFGVDKEQFDLLTKRICYEGLLDLVGIHYYSGTQKKIKKVAKELAMLDEYAKHIKTSFEINKLELEYGPSLMVEYFQDDKCIGIIEQLEQLKQEVDKVTNYDNITLEFGRFIVSDCGNYYTRINDVKNSGYIILDGGIHQISYYGQIMGMKKPFMKILDKDMNSFEINKNDEYNKWTLCGSLCTVNDVIVREVPMENPKCNDIIVFENVGAYSVTEGMSLFLSRELPAIYIYSKEGKIKCIRSRKEIYSLNTKDN